MWNSKSSVAVACFLPGRAKDLSTPLYLACGSVSAFHEIIIIIIIIVVVVVVVVVVVIIEFKILYGLLNCAHCFHNMNIWIQKKV
jgi:hypothetical protein